MKKTTEEFIKEAIAIHGNKYDYSKCHYDGAFVKVCIICPEHGEFWQTPDNHINQKSGCPKCKGKYSDKKEWKDRFVQRAKLIHNNKYDYSKVEFSGTKSKVCIICPEHGEFWQDAYSHLSGSGCPKCSGKFMDREYFIEKSVKIHDNKYDYSKVEYKKNSEPVCIICPEHGEFWQRPSVHLEGRGCPKCGVKKNISSLIKGKERFVNEALIVHGNKYDYSKVCYVNARTKVCIICPEHGEFWQTPYKHVIGQGCPMCKQSHLEREVYNELKRLGIVFEQEKSFKWLGRQRVDFFVPSLNLCIECQGTQHYRPEDFANKGKEWARKSFHENVERDRKKRKACKDNNVFLEYISYKDCVHDKIGDIITKYS